MSGVRAFGPASSTPRGTCTIPPAPRPPRSEAALEAALAGVINELAARHRIGAVGLALAGFVTPDRRGVRFAPHLSWRDAPVADRIADVGKLGAPSVRVTLDLGLCCGYDNCVRQVRAPGCVVTARGWTARSSGNPGSRMST
jgi:hypothetical protein